MDTNDVCLRESDSSSICEEPNIKTIQSQHASVAKFLLKNKFLLSALEFHMELMEKGYESFELRDYFSNPGNFEGIKEDVGPAKPLARTSSITTFDSLDFTRMSDDGGSPNENRIQTLEYQLRSANEKIQKLQNELTFITGEKKLPAGGESVVASSSVLGDLASQTAMVVGPLTSDRSRTPQATPGLSLSGALDALSSEPILPHEKRALNYLVNEYLLQNNYKITSNTFGDENEGEDLESWDEVGLHIAQPPSLCSLLRDFGSRMVALPATAHAECQVETVSAEQLFELETEVEELRLSQTNSSLSIESLRRQVEGMESELASTRDNVVLLEKELIERRLTVAEHPTEESPPPSDSDKPNTGESGPEGRRSPEGSSDNPRPSLEARLRLSDMLFGPKADFTKQSPSSGLYPIRLAWSPTCQ